MRQSSLLAFASTKHYLAPGTPVVDLFCGIGGFSNGAKMAGHKIVLAVDCDSFLLASHIRAHPNCTHICAELPRDDLPLPPPNTNWHLHMSPPCQRLSIMQPHQYRDERKKAVDLVEWCLQLVRDSKPSSFSLEQVNHAAVRAKLDALKRRFPLMFDWIVVDAVDFGVPQHRKRIIAGSPSIIAKLRFATKKRKRCVLDVIPSPPRPFIRNALYSRPDHRTHEMVAVPLKDQIRSVANPSYTILASGNKRWADEEGNVLRHLTADELALLQSFPEDYPLPWDPVVARCGVGNALPPLLAAAFMACEAGQIQNDL